MILLVDNIIIYIYYGSYGSYRDNSNYRDIFVKITVVIFWAIPPSPSHYNFPIGKLYPLWKILCKRMCLLEYARFCSIDNWLRMPIANN